MLINTFNGVFLLLKFNLNVLGDKMLEQRIKIKAKEHGISELQLIKIYLEQGLNNDVINQQDGLSDEELNRIFRESHEEDIKLGIKHNQGNFEELIEEIKFKTNGEW